MVGDTCGAVTTLVSEGGRLKMDGGAPEWAKMGARVNLHLDLNHVLQLATRLRTTSQHRAARLAMLYKGEVTITPPVESTSNIRRRLPAPTSATARTTSRK